MKQQPRSFKPAKEPAQRRALSHLGGEVEAQGDSEIASRLTTAFAIDPDPEAARLHVHGFHSYPARMHPTIARRLIELFTPVSGTVLDPFCGSGTVLVEARLAGRGSTGVDLNPLASALATLKSAGASPRQVEQLLSAARQVQASAEARRKARAGATQRYPHTDTIQFEPHVLLELDGLREGISGTPPGFPRSALWLVLSSLLTKVSRKRGDTGEVQEQPRRLASGYTLRLFLKKAEELASRLQEFAKALPRSAPPSRVLCGDARDLSSLAQSSIDAVISSPPYPGNYDYLSQHETRLRWLGLNPSSLASNEIGARRRLESLGGVQAQALFSKDLSAVLRGCSRVLRPGGVALVLIADSVVAGRALWAEALLRGCAKAAGLRWLATASQQRPYFHPAAVRAFSKHPRFEHLIALCK